METREAEWRVCLPLLRALCLYLCFCQWRPGCAVLAGTLFLLIFAKYLSLYLQIFRCTYRGTHTQAHMYNQHTRGMAKTRHRSLVERGGRKALRETLHPQKKIVRKNPIFTKLKKRFEHIELPAKLLDYFFRSNKSNINRTTDWVRASSPTRT